MSVLEHHLLLPFCLNPNGEGHILARQLSLNLNRILLI